MTPRERILAALEGRSVDRPPVTSVYHHLYHLDHFGELTGRPQAENQAWRFAPVEEHLATYRLLVEQAPFELLQPQTAALREDREHIHLVQREGAYFVHDDRHDSYRPAIPRSGHADEYTANETMHIRDLAEAREKLVTVPAEKLIATGANDYVEAAVSALGDQYAVMCGGAVGTLWACHGWVGLTNLLGLMLDQPQFIDYLCARALEQNIEVIRQLAASGGDVIFLDDAIATSEMISPAHYERFCWPGMAQMVREVRRLGKKALVIYYGGVADRLERIADLGADALSTEASNKGYVNDIARICETVGGRLTVFGNVDSVGLLHRGSDAALEAEMARQGAAGRRARGFVHCTGSPITPGTPLSRVRRFLELAGAPVSPPCSAGGAP
jgi:uroporphyrinogen-III decarboxylase